MAAEATVVCSDRSNHIWPRLERWCGSHGAKLVQSASDVTCGELLLLVSCTEIFTKEIRDRFTRTLVIHESDLPQGRGWSPFAWQILEGRKEIVVSLIEAADRVDAGGILAQQVVRLEGHELAPEINEKRDSLRVALMDWALVNFRTAVPVEQFGRATYYGRRRPEDSRIDPERSLAEQFDLLRICEPRFPAFFDLRGHRYEIELRKSA